MESEIIAGLVNRGLPLHVAQGIVANMISESGLNPGINEANPTVPGSRGGYGLYQLTGPRRREYEAYAAGRGIPLDSVDGQLDFMMTELQGSERSAFQAILGTSDAVSAAQVYSDKFLRPGIPHMKGRLDNARRLAGGEYQPSQGGFPQGNALAQPGMMQQPQNALASMEQPQQRQPFQAQNTMLDPRSFMTAATMRNTLGAPYA